MTDHELLEKAAKAAGYDKSMETEGRCDMSGNWKVFIKKRYWVGGRECTQTWNPLTDDGDALRLAAKLYLWEAVRLAHREVTADVDIYAATRRAIVLAAAAIGEKA